jgi:hypothetical protein
MLVHEAGDQYRYDTYVAQFTAGLRKALQNHEFHPEPLIDTIGYT